MSRCSLPVGDSAHLLLHLGWHFAPNNLQSELLPMSWKLALIACGEASLTEHLSNLIHCSILAIEAGGFNDLWRWLERRLFFFLGGFGSHGCSWLSGLDGTAGT